MSRCVGPSCALSVLPTFLFLLLNILDILRTKVFQNPKFLSRKDFWDFLPRLKHLSATHGTKVAENFSLP